MPKIRQRLLDPRPIYYVYVLFDWLGIPFYVGKGHGNRINGHEKKSDLSNQLKNEIIEQTWMILDEIPKTIVRDQLPETIAYETEIAFIGAIGRLDLGTGPLTNLTPGGEGCRIPTERRRAAALKMCETLGFEGMSTRSKLGWANKTEEERESWCQSIRLGGLKTIATLGPEGRHARALKTVETLGPEGLSARSRKSAETRGPEGHKAAAIKRNETLGLEGHKVRVLKGNETLGPEGRRARALKGAETIGPEGLKERARKSHETRRARLALLSEPPPCPPN